MRVAAKLIKSDLKLINHSKDHYPTSEEMSAEKAAAFVPESLRKLLQTLLPANSSTKVAALGQAITQAA